MKAHINKTVTDRIDRSFVESKLKAIPGTYTDLRREYVNLLKMTDMQKANALSNAQGLIEEDGANAFIRVFNIIMVAMKWSGLKASTARKIYKIATERVIPMRRRYIAHKHGEDGASDEWMQNELEDYLYLNPGTEM